MRISSWLRYRASRVVASISSLARGRDLAAVCSICKALSSRFEAFAGCISERSIPIRDRQFLRRKQSNDFAALGGDDQFLLDSRRGASVRCRAVGLERKHHAFLDLEGMIQRNQARDDRPFVEGDSEAVAELQRKGLHFV